MVSPGPKSGSLRCTCSASKFCRSVWSEGLFMAMACWISCSASARGPASGIGEAGWSKPRILAELYLAGQMVSALHGLPRKGSLRGGSSRGGSAPPEPALAAEPQESAVGIVANFGETGAIFVQKLVIGLGQRRFVQQVGTPLPGPAQGFLPAPAGDIGVIARQQDIRDPAQLMLD